MGLDGWRPACAWPLLSGDFWPVTPGVPAGRAGRGGRRRSQGSGGGEVGADVVVVQGAVGVQGDPGAEQGGGGLELERVEQVAVVGDVAAEPAGEA
jgi:hypothetical protein